MQISFYATADSPDKNYEKKREVYIPTPEIRSPIVPVEEAATVTETTETSTTAAETATTVTARTRENNSDTAAEDTPEPTDTRTVTTTSQTTTTTTETTVTSAVTTVPKPDRSKDFLLNGLKFYGSAETERRKMSAYEQTAEYKKSNTGQPWEQIVEYSGVTYLDKKCDADLSFTSLGLVGINYFDPNNTAYSYWTAQLTEIYGEPSVVQYDYMEWSDSPVGSGTKIYVFTLEDGVQISFYADDSGSS